MLQRDNLFRRREEPLLRPISPAPTTVPVAPAASAPAAASNLAAVPAAEVQGHSAPGAKPGEGSKLIVGPEVKLKGVEITDCDTLVVEGRVESALDSRVIHIAENGVFNGTASIDIAEIHGRFDGELTARKQLIIHASGKVAGKIRYGSIRIEEGGQISGEIGSLSAIAAKS